MFSFLNRRVWVILPIPFILTRKLIYYGLAFNNILSSVEGTGTEIIISSGTVRVLAADGANIMGEVVIGAKFNDVEPEVPIVKVSSAISTQSGPVAAG